MLPPWFGSAATAIDRVVNETVVKKYRERTQDSLRSCLIERFLTYRQTAASVTAGNRVSLLIPGPFFPRTQAASARFYHRSSNMLKTNSSAYVKTPDCRLALLGVTCYPASPPSLNEAITKDEDSVFEVLLSKCLTNEPIKLILFMDEIGFVDLVTLLLTLLLRPYWLGNWIPAKRLGPLLSTSLPRHCLHVFFSYIQTMGYIIYKAV